MSDFDYEHAYEVCPHCEEEVMLDAELKVQTCPNCGMRIVTCSMCRACDANDGKNYCSNCCLDYQANAENEEEGRTPNIEKPKKYKKYRFYSEHWVDIKVEVEDGETDEDAFEKAQDMYNCGEYSDAQEHWENTDAEDVTDELID